MKIKIWIIAQAVKKKFEGLKSPVSWASAVLMFLSREDAENYLIDLITNRQKEIRMGLRDIDNLNPEKGLDFCIIESEIDISTEKMLTKNWIL